MDSWQDVRLIARARHAEALLKTAGVRRADILCAAAADLHDLQIDHYDPGTKASEDVFGFLERISLILNVANGQSPLDEVVVVAHELGHFHLHIDPIHYVTNKNPGLGGDAVETGVAVVEGYSPRERKEVQADVFAGEFLCPSDWLAAELKSGKSIADISKVLGVPHHLVVNQAVRALLLPPLAVPDKDAPKPAIQLDDSQAKAATWSQGPLLVDAGPGTGKTRTLVKRVEHLLSQKVSPVSILALTFSNKAAAEMRERLGAAVGPATIEMWIGTFHAFGLELLSRFPGRINRSRDMRIVDQTGALAMLEANLARLDLVHYQNLYDPALELTGVLKAISRCKDEMIVPEDYAREAQQFLDTCGEAERENAEKAVEVARVYRVYEQILKECDAVDFGDLVMQAARLLETDATLNAEYRSRFKHVLVDEYQDVNLASARLLKALCPPATDVWVVADQRQSIYRFRGAEPSNVRRFAAEFGGAEQSLAFNYRSGAPVVRTFESFAAGMSGRRGGTWTANRGGTGSVTLTVAPDQASEIAAIRDRILALKSQGIPFGDQVILGRSHLTLSRICTDLEQYGIPLLYLGDLFERPEIRDLLSLIAIDGEVGNVGFIRVAALPEYSVSRSDARATVQWASTHQKSISETLAHIDDIDGLTQAGRDGLKRLAGHLSGLGPETSPWTLLTTYLLERSSYLSPLLASDDSAARQKLVAIYQLLKVCGEHLRAPDSSRKALLARIRRIESLDDDRIYRAVSSEASDVDAVRVMTIHGSKGLEFGAVHVPFLGARHLPAPRHPAKCSPPPTLSRLIVVEDDHHAEEECLFFVALSRARDHLSLTRAERYGKQNSKPSRYLDKLRLSAPRTAPQVREPSPIARLAAPAPQTHYEERALAAYMICPAKYAYQHRDNLVGKYDDAAYPRFHRCVFRTIGWLETEREQGRLPDRAAALGQLEREWLLHGPVGNGFEPYLRGIAEQMIANMADLISSEQGRYDREEWSVPLGGRHITITPDRVFIDVGGTIHVQRIRTGRQTKSEPTKEIYGLLRHGARLRYPGKTVAVESFYPATGTIAPTDPTVDAKSLAAYTAAMDDIERGDFHAIPQARTCPTCPHYFICGT